MVVNAILSSYNGTLLEFAKTLYEHFGYEGIAQVELSDGSRYGGLSYDTEKNKILVTLQPARDYALSEKTNSDPRVKASYNIISKKTRNLINGKMKKVDADFLYTIFCICHELGHYVDYQNQAHETDNNNKRDNEIAKIEIAYQQQLEKGISPESAAKRREIAYRNLPEERSADNYAEECLKILLSDPAFTGKLLAQIVPDESSYDAR
ncbi:hypothetical protein [Collinsella tanakaei]|uniref:hypothetical protein n=1 Tax=Collinsella tanakaei TaxID=626935 RepID=UPI0025A401D2|nr:hypothetical protein [Collinsella tanakaei]MDM8302482.1 hypothetical protein [Collinsella tanakaei]